MIFKFPYSLTKGDHIKRFGVYSVIGFNISEWEECLVVKRLSNDRNSSGQVYSVQYSK